MTSTNFHENGNGNGPINGKGIKHRSLSHSQLVALAADAVSGVQSVVPSLGQAPSIFEGVTEIEVREEIPRREAAKKANAAEKILFAFADLWAEQSVAWRVQAIRWLSTGSDYGDVRNALNMAALPTLK